MIKRIETTDGSRCVELLQRTDGSYQFREGKWYPPKNFDGYETPGYWGYLFESGLYLSLEDAEREAVAVLAAEPGSIFRADDC